MQTKSRFNETTQSKTALMQSSIFRISAALLIVVGMGCAKDNNPDLLAPNKPPELLMSPTANLYKLPGDTGEVRCTAFDEDGWIKMVCFYENGILAKVDSTSPWKFTSVLGDRAKVISAVAFDNLNAASESKWVNMYTPPEYYPNIQATMNTSLIRHVGDSIHISITSNYYYEEVRYYRVYLNDTMMAQLNGTTTNYWLHLTDAGQFLCYVTGEGMNGLEDRSAQFVFTVLP